MFIIPNQYKVEAGKSVDPGAVELKCSVCGERFAVPGNVVAENPNPNCTCQECVEKADKLAAASGAADLKADTNAATADEISKALGK